MDEALSSPSRRLRAWALLPSLDEHPARQAELPAAAAAWLARLTPGSTAWRRLHRHASADRLRALEPLDGAVPDGIAAALALLPLPAWDRLQSAAGAGLAARQLRRVIARDAVAQLRQQLGAPAYAWALAQPGVEDPLPDGGLLCERWGAALVWRALDAVPAAWAQRLRLRLPLGAQQDADTEPVSRYTPPQAAHILSALIPLVEAV